MKKIIIVVFVFLTYSIFSQEFVVPRNYRFRNSNDYKKYEKEILQCIEYLENAPVNDLSKERKKINSFFLDWLTGTPYVHITISNYLGDLYEKNKIFLIIFMAGWTKYSINNPNEDDKIKGNLAGVETLIRVYQKGNGVIEDNKILDLIKIQEEGNLEIWIMDQLNNK